MVVMLVYGRIPADASATSFKPMLSCVPKSWALKPPTLPCMNHSTFLSPFIITNPYEMVKSI